MITTFYRLEADIVSAQFLTGHSVDHNRYLQIMKAPERAEREWSKYRQFLDSGVTGETQEKIQQQGERIEDLTRQLADAELRRTQTIELAQTLLSKVEAMEAKMKAHWGSK